MAKTTSYSILSHGEQIATVGGVRRIVRRFDDNTNSVLWETAELDGFAQLTVYSQDACLRSCTIEKETIPCF